MRVQTLNGLELAPADSSPPSLVSANPSRFACSFLEDDVARVTFLPDAPAWRLRRTWMVTDVDGGMPREGRDRDDLARFSRPTPTIQPVDQGYTLSTSTLSVTANRDTGALAWATVDGPIFMQDVPLRAYAYDATGDAIFHYQRLYEDACFYGFGERAGPLNKRGMRMEMRNLDALGYNARTTDPLYKHFPVYITYLPGFNIAYGLFYDNLATTVFDMGREIDAIWGPYTKYEAHGGDLDYYLLYGPTVPDVVEKIAWLTGKPFLPPRWSLGYLGSTMRYTEAPDAQAQLKQFADLTTQHDIPCDGFHLSSGYTTNADGVRNVFTWNNARVPDPSAMVADFHAANIKLMANVKPYVLDSSPHYPARLKSGGVVRNLDGTPHISRFWSGGAYESTDGVYIDFTSAAGYDWWQQGLREKLFAYGVDAIWNDNNEYELWDEAAVCDGFGEPVSVGLARPLQTLLMGHASYHETRTQQPEQRPFVLSRSGCPGIQRYAQSWSGDNDTSWETLRYNIPMGLGMSLSGAPNTGHDVGGFHGGRPSSELFVRWVQNGVLHPRFTIHSWNTDGTVNEPWMYPEVLSSVREAIDFRYRLLPYLYSLFVEAHETGHPIIRPTLYHYTSDPATHHQSFEFLLGPNLLVASVTEMGGRTRDVYLPAGTGWTDFHTGQRYAGGQSVVVEAPLNRIPLLVPDGGMIPTGRRMRHVSALPDDERTVYAFPHPAAGMGRFTLYEDDGETNAYQNGARATVELVLTSSPDELTLNLRVDESGYRLPYRSIRLRFPPGEARPLHAEGFVQQERGPVDLRVIEVFF